MKCTNCHSEVSESVKFCPECGAKINNIKFCSQCGTRLQPNAKFCLECGAPIEEGEQKDTPSPAPEASAKADKKPTTQEPEAPSPATNPAKGTNYYDLLRIINIVGSALVVWGLVRLLISDWAIWLQWVIGICVGIGIVAFFGDIINKKEEKR
ncbi:MAG: zinc-ribbon domain-containing protein [Prevotella sp.]|nr:zinc-ribbon domain-containing protein [Prevotella sp.]